MIQALLMAFTLAYVIGVGTSIWLLESIISPGPLWVASAFPVLALAAFNLIPRRKPPLYFSMLLICAAGFLMGMARYNGALAIDTPNHLSKFLDQDRFSQTIVIGTVDREPDIREKKTIVSVKPEKILKARGKVSLSRVDEKEFTPVDGGLLWVEIAQEAGDLQYQVAYGQRVIIVSNLASPPPATNPGMFSYRDFLHHQNYFAMAKIKKPFELKILGVGNVNPIVAFSLKLKNDFLVNIKKTMPFPESAFLGGVQLGCRGGVSQKVQDDFRKSGVSHVLAVSGLHVTIIATMFYIILSSMKIPRKVFVPIIIAFLIVFTIITGARPSSTRAALMNSLVLIIMTYFNHSLKSSLLFGLSVAAVFVLWNSPLILFEPGFTLSFAAILSLAFITEPFEEFCCKWCRGMKMVALIAEGIVAIPLFCFFGDLMKIRLNLILFAVLCLVFFVWAALMDRRGRTVDVSFEDFPPIVRSFVGAQGAILIGMMWPLSAFYFNQISLSAPLANFIAIPLIGVIVQVGLIAGIFGMMPLFGIYLALLLNAGNWICVNFFLWMATYFADLLPAPMIPSPTPGQLFLYYLLVAVFCFRSQLGPWIKLRLKGALESMKSPSTGLRRALAAGLMLGILISPLCILWGSAGKSLKLILLDVRYGDSLLVEAPDGTASLVDGGGKSVKLDEATGKQVEFSQGSRTVYPVLLKKRITKLKYMVLTSLAPEYSGGFEHLVKEFGPAGLEAIYTPWDLSSCGQSLELEELVELLNCKEFSSQRNTAQCLLMHQCLSRIYREAVKLGIPLRQLKSGDLIDFGGGALGRVLWPQDRGQGHPSVEAYRIGDTSMALRLEYGSASLLIASDISDYAQKKAAELPLSGKKDSRIADIMILPCHGAGDLNQDFIKWSGAEVLLSSYGFAGMKTGRKRDSNIYGLNAAFPDRPVLSTSDTGAIMLQTRGKGWNLETLATGQEMKIESRSLEPVSPFPASAAKNAPAEENDTEPGLPSTQESGEDDNGGNI